MKPVFGLSCFVVRSKSATSGSKTSFANVWDSGRFVSDVDSNSKLLGNLAVDFVCLS